MPLVEPITFEQAALQLRGVDVSERPLIERYISAARRWVERHTGHILVRRTVTETFDRFSSHLPLTYRPIVSVTNVGYLDADNVARTISDLGSAIDRYPARVYPAAGGSGWPSVASDSQITVSYVAGYAAGDEPEDLLHVILMLVTGMQEGRGAIPADTAQSAEWALQSYLPPAL